MDQLMCMVGSKYGSCQQAFGYMPYIVGFSNVQLKKIHKYEISALTKIYLLQIYGNKQEKYFAFTASVDSSSSSNHREIEAKNEQY